MRKFIPALLAATLLFCSCAQNGYDVVIIGGGASGTAAGIRAARMGAKTLIIEEYDWLGGMLTSAGVSATDGNYKLRGAFWGEFRDSLEQHYGGSEALKTGWVSHVMFEPSVGAAILQNIATAEPNLSVWFRATPQAILRSDKGWSVDVLNGGKLQSVQTKVLIDATELGDIAKQLGVKYDIGMDSQAVTGEDIAPQQSNSIIQDLTYVMVLKDYGRDMTIARPDNYNAELFACACDNALCKTPKEKDRLWSREKLITYGELPNKKYMVNWPIEGNDFYLDMTEMTPLQRVEAVKQAKNHTMCFLYFLQTELGFSTLSLADDEFPTDDMLPFIPYHRESRRIDGLVRFTLNDITAPYSQPTKLYRTAIGVGDYPVDQHHTRYSGWGELPNLYFHPIPSYGLPLGVMIPRNVQGLIVAEKSISVTNIVNGSTRLQPVVLQIGEAAGALAALSALGNRDVSQVGVREVQNAILAAGGYLLPYLDRTNSDPQFKAIQRIGATGIIKGEGANVGWENQTWFHADSTISTKLLSEGLKEIYPNTEVSADESPVTLASLCSMLAAATGGDAVQLIENTRKAWDTLPLSPFAEQKELTRAECAVVIDHIANPFEIEVDINGNLKK